MSTDPKNLVGMTLSGRYMVERRIGEGGMGAVFEAMQLSLGRRVAIKVVKPVKGLTDVDIIRRFELETEAIARLGHHPNIVQVVDAGRSDDGSPDGTMWLAMELLSGENVRQVLKRERGMSLARALAIVEDVASALVAAHAAGVIHRDLKADNIMLVTAAGKEETAKVLDFGVAKLTSQTEAPPVTGSGFVAGTPGCIAPEQMIGKTDDPRSDLYSVGVLLFEMLAGEPPFAATSGMELMLRHLTDVPRRVGDVAERNGREEVPAPVDDLVASLLEKEPSGRPASAAELVEIVRGLRDANRATQPDVRVPPGARRRRATDRSGALDSASGPVTGSTGPVTGSSAPPVGDVVGSRVVLAPPATASAATAPVTTSPTTAQPAATSTATSRTRVMAAAVGVVCVVVVVVGVWRPWARHEELSQNPIARAAIERAIEDYWNLDLDKLEEETDAAIAADPTAPMPHVLRSSANLIAKRPLVRVDIELFLAKQKARLHASSSKAERPRVESFIEVLSALNHVDTRRLWAAHCASFGGCTDLERVIVANRMANNSTPNADIFAVVDAVESQRPAAMLLRGRLARWDERRDDARKLLTEGLQMAPGRLPLVEALVDNELEDGHPERAIELLRKLEDKEDKAAIRLAYLRARSDKDSFAPILSRLRGLPQNSDRRIDGLASVGYHFAALGRFADAEVAWRESVDARVRDQMGNARALETAGLAVLFFVVREDEVAAERWLGVMSEIGFSSGPGAERFAAFQHGARALLSSVNGKIDPVTAAGELTTLEASDNDVPIVTEAVRFELSLQAKRYDEATQLVNGMEACFRYGRLAALAYAKGDLAGAKTIIDQGLSEKSQRACTSGDDLVPYVRTLMFADLITDQAALAMEQNDVDGARAALARYRAFWPNADPPPITRSTHRVGGFARLPAVEAFAR